MTPCQGAYFAHQIFWQLLKGIRDNAVVPETQMDDGILFPVVWFVINRQALKQLPLSQKDGLQSGDKQRLAEAPRARQKKGFPRRVDQTPQVFRLVDVQIISRAQLFKVIYACCQILH